MSRFRQRCALALALAGLATLGPGCEEVLEVCAPCGTLEQGSITIAGEPRLDGTLEAAYLLWTRTTGEARAFDGEMAELAGALGIPVPQNGEYDLPAAQSVVDAIREQLVDVEGATAIFDVVPASCWVESELALARQLSCEDRLNCYIPDDCAIEQRGACTGMCVGQCRGGCEGWCFAEASADNEECLGGCIGACSLTEPAACAARCSGSCTSSCSDYTSNAECDGSCAGICTGDCTSTLPFDCVGLCRGLCQVPRGEENSCDGQCRGSCPLSVCDGRCRGNFRPEGCDLPDRCEGLYDCQETARALAWAHMRCGGSSARAGIVFSPAFAGDRAELTALAQRVERALVRVAESHALLALLVDGTDDTGGVLPEALEETASDDRVLPGYLEQPEYLAELSVVADRVHLPLSGLKARTGALITEATAGDYQLAAGPLPCVQPAFEEAHARLGELVPTTGSGQLQPDRSAGLYRVVDAQRALLELVWPGAE